MRKLGSSLLALGLVAAAAQSDAAKQGYKTPAAAARAEMQRRVMSRINNSNDYSRQAEVLRFFWSNAPAMKTVKIAKKNGKTETREMASVKRDWNGQPIVTARVTTQGPLKTGVNKGKFTLRQGKKIKISAGAYAEYDSANYYGGGYE